MSVKKFTDVAVFQPSSYSYLKSLKDFGSCFNFVKLTEGGWNDEYLNSNAFAQIRNSLKVWGKVGIYHFWHGESASYFLYEFKRTGLDPKTTKFALDVEDSYLPGNVTSGVNKFEHQLILYGFKKSNIWTYFPYSWISGKKITPSKFKYGFAWTAEYPYSSVYMNNRLKSTSNFNPGYNAWQFSGLGSQDWSFDYTGTLTSPTRQPRKRHVVNNAMNDYLKHGSLFQCTQETNVYSDLAFKHRTKFTLAKNSVFPGRIVKDDKITRIKTKIGFLSSNKHLVKAVNK